MQSSERGWGQHTQSACACTLLMTPPRASAPDRCMPSDLLSLARFCVSLLALACHRSKAFRRRPPADAQG